MPEVGPEEEGADVARARMAPRSPPEGEAPPSWSGLGWTARPLCACVGFVILTLLKSGDGKGVV